MFQLAHASKDILEILSQNADFGPYQLNLSLKKIHAVPTLVVNTQTRREEMGIVAIAPVFPE